MCALESEEEIRTSVHLKAGFAGTRILDYVYIRAVVVEREY